MITRSFGLGRALIESNNSFGNWFLLHPSLYWATHSILVVFPFLNCLSLFQPERINPELNQKGYSVKSDIWSLGITMVTYDHHCGLWGSEHETGCGGWSLGTQKQMPLTEHLGTLSCLRWQAVYPGWLFAVWYSGNPWVWSGHPNFSVFYYHMTFINSCILIDSLSNRHGVNQFLIVQIKWL